MPTFKQLRITLSFHIAIPVGSPSPAWYVDQAEHAAKFVMNNTTSGGQAAGAYPDYCVGNPVIVMQELRPLPECQEPSA